MSKKIKILSHEYNKLALWTKDKMADIKQNDEIIEYYEDLAKRLELKAEEVKNQSEDDIPKKEKKQWMCNSCHKVTTIKMVKQCENCKSYDTVVPYLLS